MPRVACGIEEAPRLRGTHCSASQDRPFRIQCARPVAVLALAEPGPSACSRTSHSTAGRSPVSCKASFGGHVIPNSHQLFELLGDCSAMSLID